MPLRFSNSSSTPSPAPTPASTGTAVVYQQSVASTSWTVHHGLGRYPAAASVYDPAGNQRPLAVIENPDVNTTVVLFNSPQTGSVVIY